jgi:pyruvate ferredoxin oxidoreductase alpha subunit
MGKTKHMLAPANAPALAAIEAETERRWARLKAMHEHPGL